ncbi:MAG: glycosyltransferase family A protein [Ginsengibacter sp.]
MLNLFFINLFIWEMTANETRIEKYTSSFFSVIITTYNRSSLLKRALDSLVAQTETDWGAIIIDDGSTDNTACIVKPYLAWNNKIKYLKQKSKGATFSKNTGIFLSEGKFVTFLDSDDEYSAAHLASRKIILLKNKKIELLHGGVKVIGNHYVPDRFDYNKIVPLSRCAIGGTFFIKKNIALLLNGFTEIPLGSDADFLERANKAGINTMKTELPTYLYHRETENSITNNLMRCQKRIDFHKQQFG